MTNIMSDTQKILQGAYNDLLVIVWLTALGGGISMLWCIYLVIRGNEATQSDYLYFWGATFLVLLITSLMLSIFIFTMNTKYNNNRTTL